MSYYPAPVVPNDIRLRYPEFAALTDQQIQDAINQATNQIQYDRWGSWLSDGIKAFVGHTLLLRYQTQLGLVDQVKSIESDKTKATPAQIAAKHFLSTSYGLEFLQLQSQLPVFVGFVV